MQNEMAACPFCGGAAEWRWHSGSALWIECSNCGAIGPQDEDTSDTNSDKTLAAWNTRPAALATRPTGGSARHIVMPDGLTGRAEAVITRLEGIVDSDEGGPLDMTEVQDLVSYIAALRAGDGRDR